MDYLVREALPKMEYAGGYEQCGKGNWQMCHHIITTNTYTTKASGKVFKSQNETLSCNSEKVLYLMR